MCDYVGDCPVARRNSFNFQASSQVGLSIKVVFVTAPHLLSNTLFIPSSSILIGDLDSKQLNSLYNMCLVFR
jgi:hypothetical protein